MKFIIQWENAEEGTALVYSFGKEICSFQIYEMDEDEAELSLRMPEEKTEISKKVVLRVTKALKKLYRELQKEGYYFLKFAADSGSFAECMLREIECSTGVVSKEYSEFMLKKALDRQDTDVMQEKKQLQNLTILQLENEKRCVWNGEEDLFSCRVKPYRDGFYIYEVVVREGRRNQGIGTAAMQEILNREELAGTLYLQVGSYNERALHIYRKLGFETETELCYYSVKPV